MKVGDRLLGLRLSTPELAGAARAVLAPAIVAGVAAPANVSVLAPEVRTGHGLFLCYRSSALAARARSPRRALEAAISLLSSFAPPAVDELVAIPAVVAVRDGSAVVMSEAVRMVQDGLAPRLRGAGWSLLDSRTADIDASTGEVVVAPPAVAFDGRALAALPRPRNESRPAAPGRYRVAAWVGVAAGGAPSDRESRAARVARLASTVEEISAGRWPLVMAALAAMVDGAAWLTTPTLDAAGIAAAVSSVGARP